MPYDAKPTVDDVILSTWQERDNVYVRLFLRRGDDDVGPEVIDWVDGDCEAAFENGYLKAGRGGIKDSNRELAQSAFEYAVDLRAEKLLAFEAQLSAAVTGIEAGLLAAYEAKLASDPGKDGEDEDERVERLMRETAADAMSSEGPLPALTTDRVNELHEYLVDTLDDLIPAPSPAP